MSDERKKGFEAGHAAWRAGQPRDNGPYSGEFGEGWLDGWDNADTEAPARQPNEFRSRNDNLIAKPWLDSGVEIVIDVYRMQHADQVLERDDVERLWLWLGAWLAERKS